MRSEYNESSLYNTRISASDNLHAEALDNPDGAYNEMNKKIEQLNTRLDKERFFNKLLNQELNELKGLGAGKGSAKLSRYWFVQKGISKTAFYTLLVIALMMAAYIAATIFLRS